MGELLEVWSEELLALREQPAALKEKDGGFERAARLEEAVACLEGVCFNAGASFFLLRANFGPLEARNWLVSKRV